MSVEDVFFSVKWIKVMSKSVREVLKKNRFEYDPLAKWHEIAKFAKQSKIM